MKKLAPITTLLIFALVQALPFSSSVASESTMLQDSAPLPTAPVEEFSSSNIPLGQSTNQTLSPQAQTTTEFLVSAESPLSEATQSESASSPFLDSDQDFMPDVWEENHGLNSLDPNDAKQDPDQDSLTNLEEYLVNTDPYLNTQQLSDEQLVQLYDRKATLFFWGEAKASNYFLVPDRVPIDGGALADAPISVAGVGFQLASYVIMDEHEWQDHGEIYNRVVTILRRMRELQAPERTDFSHKHGFFYHFFDGQTGQGWSEVSTIDQALFLSGALLAGEYYKGTEAERLAREIYNDTDWTFFLNPQSFLYLAWYPDSYNHQGNSVEGGNWGNQDSWNRYSEELVMYLLAIGSTTHPLPESSARNVWNSLSRDMIQYTSPVTGQVFPPYAHVGALFTHQYSQAFVDFRRRRDDSGIDYFDNSVTASLVNRRFSFDLNDQDPGRYDTYVHDNQNNVGVWGLSAADRSDGYDVLQPVFSEDPWVVEANTDSGTVAPESMIGSLPFIPSEILRDLRFLFENRNTLFAGEPIDGVYGFVNAYNPGQALSGTRHISRWAIGLDLGAAVMGMENFISGLPWKFFMRLPEIQNAMNIVGFQDEGHPFIINFDNGTDPNSFGGYGGGFGPTPATRSYANIGDPFPDKNYGPQGYAQEFTGSSQSDGVWLGLNGHDISRWDRVSFWIRGDQGAEDILIGLKDVSTNEVQVRISDYLTDGITSEWQEVRIPLRVFLDGGVRLVSMDNISFTFAGANGGKIWVDDIAFLGDEFRPSAVRNLTASVQNSIVQLHWDWNTEPDVVGYRVLRKATGDANFVDITPSSLLLVANTFQDNLSGILGSVTYKIIAVDNSTFRNESAPVALTIDAATGRLLNMTAYHENGEIASTDDYRYTSAGVLLRRDYRQYTESAVLVRYVIYNYYSDGETINKSTDTRYANGVRTRLEQNYYNSSGALTRTLYTNYYPNGTTVKDTSDYRYANGILTYLYLKFYSLAGVLERSINNSYYSDGQTLKVSGDTLYANGVRTNFDQSYYDSAGVLTRTIYRSYYPDGITLKDTSDYRYANGVLTYWYLRFYHSAGALERYVSYSYYADGVTVKVLSDYRYANGVKTHLDRYEYDTASVLTRALYYTYYPDGRTVQFKDDYRYMLHKRYYYEYDPSGALIRLTVYDI